MYCSVTSVRRAAVLLVAAAALVAGGVAHAAADEIAITAGSLDARGSFGNGVLVLEGTRGFTFSGVTRTGVFAAGECNGTPCMAGERISLLASWSGMDLTGVATLDGVTYPRVGDNFDTSSTSAAMTVEFFGSLLAPHGSSPVAVVVPFVFKATFFHREGPDLIVGSGAAVVELNPITFYPEERWGVTRVLYQFGTPLPAPWVAGDIGSSTGAGRSSMFRDSIVVAGDGTDIWGDEDSFRFTYQELQGAGTVAARVVTQQRAYPAGRPVAALDPFAKSGVMIRESTAANAANVVLDMRPNGELEFMARYVSGSPTIYLGGAQTAGENVWLTLSRKSGGEIEASYSTDGGVFTVIGTVFPGTADAALAGLAVTSHDASALNGTIFDNVSVSGGGTTNLLVRGDFEDYDPPALGAPGWVSDDLLRQIAAKSETHQPRSGAKNGACWTPESLDCGIYQEVVAPRAGQYAFSVYATSDREGGLVGVNVNGALAVASNVDPSGFDNYRRYTMTFTAAAGDTLRVWMYSPAAPGYVVIDDASLSVQR